MKARNALYLGRERWLLRRRAGSLDPSGKGPCDGDSLLLTAGELCGICVRLVRKTYEFKEFHCTRFRSCFRYTCKFQRKADIFQTGTLSKQIEALEYHGNISAYFSQFRFGQRAEIASVNQYAAFRGTFQHIYTSHKCAFSGHRSYR